MYLLKKMSHNRLNQLRELQGIIDDVSRAIMWVNEREEEELVFDWGEKNIDQYVPRKQESYSVRISDWVVILLISVVNWFSGFMLTALDSFFLFIQQKLMSDLEEKEKDLNKLKTKAGSLLSNNHPASDKIEVTVVDIQTVF